MASNEKRNDKQGQNLILEEVAMPGTSSTKTRVSSKNEPNVGTLVAVEEICVCRWNRIVEQISRMQEEIQKIYSGCLSPNGLSSTAESIPFRNYMLLTKRLSKLLASAQDGLKSALAIRTLAKAGGTDFSDWEKEKQRFDPRLKDRIEKIASVFVEIRRKEREEAPKHHDSFVFANSSPSTQLVSSAEDTADIILRLRLAEISRLDLLLGQIEESVAGGVVRDELPKEANSVRIRNHISQMKRLVMMLLSAQRGYQSALLIKKKLELEVAVTPEWALSEEQQEKLFRKLMEQTTYTVYVRMETFQQDLPELEEIYLTGKIPPIKNN
jgi:hypothetical protein